MTRQEIIDKLIDLQIKLTLENGEETQDIKALISLLILTIEQGQERLLRVSIIDQFMKMLDKGPSQN